MRFRNAILTSFKGNPSIHKKVFDDQQNIIFYIFQEEICPVTKKNHIQGYLELEKQVSLKTLKSYFSDDTLHLEKRKGTQSQAISYCSKEETRKSDTLPVALGTPKKQGNRVDITRIINENDDSKRLALIEENPIIYCRYHSGIDKIINLKKDQSERVKNTKKFRNVILKNWQTTALDQLLKQSDRQILWIVDYTGNSGKTFLAKHLLANYSSHYVTNGKNSDIARSYNYEDIVIFDYSRSQQDHINYGIIEQFKNGIIFSPKYESCLKRKDDVKIICFSNFYPETSKFSKDRWNIMQLDDNEKISYPERVREFIDSNVEM